MCLRERLHESFPFLGDHVDIFATVPHEEQYRERSGPTWRTSTSVTSLSEPPRGASSRSVHRSDTVYLDARLSSNVLILRGRNRRMCAGPTVKNLIRFQRRYLRFHSLSPWCYRRKGVELRKNMYRRDEGRCEVVPE